MGYGAGALSTQWSNIVPVANYLFFYNSSTGLYAVAKLDQNGNLNTVNNGYLPRYVTHVVATDKHIFFFNAYDRSGFAGTVNTSSGYFSRTQNFGAGAFSPWTHIVDTKYGMFFYNRADGTVAVVNVQPNGLLNQTDGKVWRRVTIRLLCKAQTFCFTTTLQGAMRSVWWMVRGNTATLR